MDTPTTAKVPILLVSKISADPHGLNQRFLIRLAVDHGEVILKRGNMDVDVEVAIVDTRAVGRKDAVISALFLRNAGLTAIIGDYTKVPVDIVEDIHNFTVRVKSDGEPVRTEALVMEDAMDLYGDITDVVEFFEDNLL